MVEHSGNHLSLCGIHESGRWWDLTYWSCAEYWYDLACLSIRREVVTYENSDFVPFIFLKCLKSKEILVWKLLISRQSFKHAPFFSISFYSSTPQLPTLWDRLKPWCAHWMSLSPEHMPATFHMWAYIFLSVWKSPVLVWACIWVCIHRSMSSAMAVLCAVRSGIMSSLFFIPRMASYKSLCLVGHPSNAALIRRVTILYPKVTCPSMARMHLAVHSAFLQVEGQRTFQSLW